MGSGEPLGDRSHTSTRDARDLLDCVSFKVPQHHDLPFAGGKLHDGGQEGLLVFFQTSVPALDGLDESFFQRQLVAFLFRQIQGASMGDSRQPGSEGRRLAQGGQSTVGPDERLLRDIAGQVPILHDVQGRRPDQPLVPLHEQLERLLPAGQGIFHQLQVRLHVEHLKSKRFYCREGAIHCNATVP